MNAAFLNPVQPDDALAAVVGSAPLPRTELTKRVWDYIKANNLQDPEKMTNINADSALRAVFNGRSQVTMFEMTKLVSSHLLTPRQQEARETETSSQEIRFCSNCGCKLSGGEKFCPACGNGIGMPPKTESPGECITNVLEQCAQIARQASAYNGNPDVQANFVAIKAQNIDITACPSDFSEAYQVHIFAWQQAASIFSGDGKDQASQVAQEAWQQINTTYFDLTQIAANYGARIPRSVVGE